MMNRCGSSDYGDVSELFCITVSPPGLRRPISWHTCTLFFFNICLFGCTGSYCSMWDLHCVMQDLSLQRSGSLVVASGLRAHRLSWGTWLCCSMACRILFPWPGIELASSALQGGFLTTGPPGKSHMYTIRGALEGELELNRVMYLAWGKKVAELSFKPKAVITKMGLLIAILYYTVSSHYMYCVTNSHKYLQRWIIFVFIFRVNIAQSLYNAGVGTLDTPSFYWVIPVDCIFFSF